MITKNKLPEELTRAFKDFEQSLVEIKILELVLEKRQKVVDLIDEMSIPSFLR